MNIADFRVEPADYHADMDDLRSVRKALFVLESKESEDSVFDDLDPQSRHFIARDNQHHAIGIGRLTPNYTIDLMGVLQAWRGKGVGKSLLLALLDKARKLGWTEAKLNATADVVGFYEKFGFAKTGETLNIDKINYQTMQTTLEPADKSDRPTPKPRDSLVEIAELKGLEDTQAAIIQLVSNARRQICVYSPDLELVMYGRPEIIEALKQFAINSGGGNVMIIVQDTMTARNQPHPLIDLAQRLPSVFSLRTPVEADDLQYPSAYLINDRNGYLFRQQSSHYIGVWSPTLPSRNRQLMEEFERVWQRSQTCTEFRALGL